MFLLVVFLIPSYVSLDLKENIALEQIGLVKKSIQNKDNINAEKELNIIVAKIEILKRTKNEIVLKDIIYEIIKEKPQGIYISDFLYNKIQKKEGIEKMVTIQGVSNTRDELLKFKNLLSNIKYFGEVNLPLSNFVKDIDIPFSIDIILSNDKK